ncbi:MAG: glutamate-5-semialdehyde dehydrogenase [bacterium]|nr:glutamate-5-semialdehyde dehydrogenase [bacterium]
MTESDALISIGRAAGPTAGSSESIRSLIDDLTARARAAARALATCPTAVKNRALLAMAASFRADAAEFRRENARDLEAGRAAGLSAAMLDRLELTDKRIEAMAAALEQVAALDDPVGEILDVKPRPNGLRVGRMRVSIGVIGIIYESRPNVTADAGCLCVKSGNAVILRGGKEAFHSNAVIARLMNEAGRGAGLPEGSVQLVPTTDRAAIGELLTRNDRVDLIIPRGGKSLIEMVVKNSTIPVIKHYDGNCFVYVDRAADPKMAAEIVLNAKTQRPGVCNAAESLLVHRDVAAGLGAEIIRTLAAAGVEVRADERLRALVPGLKAAAAEDWDTEYLDLIITAGVVDSADAAIEFINTHGSHHTDAIVTDDHPTAMRFLAAVDSACVFVNCSTRFSDGGEFGMGCEIGISTDKLHARGPMGLKELTTLKFIAFGQGQLRQ